MREEELSIRRATVNTLGMVLGTIFGMIQGLVLATVIVYVVAGCLLLYGFSILGVREFSLTIPDLLERQVFFWGMAFVNTCSVFLVMKHFVKEVRRR